MKLHLPSGLRKALLACLAAVALPISLPTTVASASGIAAVLLFAGQEARADFSGPQGVDYTSLRLWQADEDTIDTMSIGEENTEVTLTGDAPPWAAENNPRSSLKYNSQGTPGPHLKLNGTDGTVTEYRYALLDDFKTIWFAGVGRHFVNGTTDFSRSIEAIYVNGAQLVFDGASLTDLTTNFFIGSSTSGANGAIGAIYVATGANIVTTGTLNVEEDAVISFASGSLSFASVNSEGKLTLATTTGGSGTFTLGGGTLQTLDLAAGVTLSLGGDLTLEGDSTISGTLTGEGNIILDKEGEITINSAGNNLAELVGKLETDPNKGTLVTLNSSGEGDVTIESSLDLTNIKLRKESGTLTLTQDGTFGQESVLDRLDVTGGSLTLNAVLYLKKGGSINSYDFGDKGGILLGDGAKLTLGGDGDVSSKIGLQDGASSAWLTLTGDKGDEENNEANFAGAHFNAGINVRFDRTDAKGKVINFTDEVTVRGDVEITDGTHVKFSKTDDVKIDGELFGDGSLVFDREGQTLTLGKGGSIGELQINQGSAEIERVLSGGSLVFGAGVTLTFDEGGSFDEMRVTGKGNSSISLGGDLEVGSLGDAPEGATYSIKKAKGENDLVHFILGVKDEKDLKYYNGVEVLENEFTNSAHKGLTVEDGVGIGFATSGTIELKDGGKMTHDFKFKGEGTGTLKFSNVREGVEFQKHLTLEDAHVEMAGGTLTITGGLILNGQNTLDVTVATADGSPYLTLGGESGLGDFKLSGDGTLDVKVSLSLLAEKNPGDIKFIKNWQDAWKEKISFHIVFEDGTEYSDASLDADGHLIWTVGADDFTGITYDTVETNADETSIKGNAVIAVMGDDIAHLTFTSPGTTHLKLVAGKDGVGEGGSGGADLSGLASVYFTGTNGYFVENGWFATGGPGTIYVRDTQLYFSGEKENTADPTKLESDFVIGESLHGAEDVGPAALALSKKVATSGSLTLKEDATIAFLLNDTKDAWMSFGGAVDGSGKTLTLSEKGTGRTAGLELKGGGTLGKLVSEGENVQVKVGKDKELKLEQGGTIAGTLEGDEKFKLNVAGGTLEVGTLSGSLSTLTLGEEAKMTVEKMSGSLNSLHLEANSELRIEDGEIKFQEILLDDSGENRLLPSLTWDTSTKTSLHLGAKQTISLGKASLTDPTGGMKLSIDLTGSVLAAADGTKGFTIFDKSWSGLEDWEKYFRFTVDGTDASRWGYEFKVDTTTGLLTWTKSDRIVPPQIGPTSGEYEEKLGYEVGDKITRGGTVDHLDATDIKHEVTMASPADPTDPTPSLKFTFHENRMPDGSVKRSNLWVDVTGGENFILDITGLHADTLLVRGDNENVRTYITLNDSSAKPDSWEGDTFVPGTTDWKGLKDVYVEGNVLLDVTGSFTQEGIQTNLHLHTTDWESTNGNESCSFFVRSNFTTTGTIDVGYYDPKDNEESLKNNLTGARLGVLGSLEVEALKGTNMQLWGSGKLVLTNNTNESRLYGELQINGSSALTILTGTFEVERVGRVGESSLSELNLGEGASFKMNGGTLYANQISMTSSSSLQFTLREETKDTALLELRSGGFTGDTPKIVLGGDSGADYYQLFGATTTAQIWWTDWYLHREDMFIFEAPEAGGKQVKLSYDGRIRFVNDLNELTFTWEGSEKDVVLNWELGGDIEWKKFDGSMSDWNKPEGFERDARLTGASGGRYTVNLLENVATGDLDVEGSATFTLQSQGGGKLDVRGLLSTTLGSTLAIGNGVTVTAMNYRCDGGAFQLLDGGTLDLSSCAVDSLTLIVGEKTPGTETSTPESGGTLKASDGKHLNLSGISGTGDLVVDGATTDADITLQFGAGDRVGSLKQKSGELHVNIEVEGSLEFLRESIIGGVVTFNEKKGSKIMIGDDLSVGLLSGGSSETVVSNGVEITDSGKDGGVTPRTLRLTGGVAAESYYWGNFTLGSQEKGINLEADLRGANNRQVFGEGDVVIWGDVTLKNGILEFYSDDVVIHGKVDARGASILDIARLSLCGVKSFTIDGENGEAGYVQRLSFSNDNGGAGSVLTLGGDLEVGSIEYSGGDSSRVRHRIENAQEETVYVMLTTKRAGAKEIETLQDFRDDYSKNDGGGTGYTGVDLRQGVGIGWAGEGELLLKGDENGGTFSTPFKLKGGSLHWTEGTQTMTDFTAAQDAQMTVTKGKLTLEQFHGELGTLTLGNGATLGVKYGTLEAQNLRAMEGTGDATLEVNISEDKARLSFGSIQGSLQLQLTGWNELGDQTIGYRLFDNKDGQWRKLWETLGEKWTETLTFLDDDGKEINSMVELTSEGVVRLRLVDGDLYWDGAASEELTWSKPYVWNSGAGGEGGATASFENGKRVHLEANGGDPANVTLDVDAIAGSMDVQGAYTLKKNPSTPHTLTVQKELTVGGKGSNLTVNEGNRLVVKDYVDIEEGGIITLATDMVIGGNIGGGGKVEKAPEADDVYVLWNNNSNGEIMWKGSSWDTYVGDVLGEGVGYGKTGRTDLSIVGAASLERNFKGEQGKTVFTDGLTLKGHKLVVGEGARIIVEGTDGLNGSKDIVLGHDKDEEGKGTIEITVSDALTNVKSNSGAELHVNLKQTPGTEDKPANTMLSGLQLEGGLVLESGEQVTFTGVNTVNGLDAMGIKGCVVVGSGSTTTLEGNVDIAYGLELDGTIAGSSNMTVHGGLTGVGSLEAQTLNLTDGEEGSVVYNSSIKVTANLNIDGGILHLKGGQLTVGNVSTSNDGRLVLEYDYDKGPKLGFNSVDDSAGKLRLKLIGFSEESVKGDGYKLFEENGWGPDFGDKIRVTGWTEDDGKNPKKLVLDKNTGNVKIYSPVDDPELENATQGYQALVGNISYYEWTSGGDDWVWDMAQVNDVHQFQTDRKTVFAGTNNEETVIQVNIGWPEQSINAAGGMCVLLGEAGFGGKYIFGMTGGAPRGDDATCNVTVGGDGLVIGEDTQVQFLLKDQIYFIASQTTVKSGARLEIDGDTGSTKRFGAVTIEDEGEVVIYQPEGWYVVIDSNLTQWAQFEGDGKLTVDLSNYAGSRDFSTIFTNGLFYHDESHSLHTFELRGAFIHVAWNDNMRAFKSLRDVVIDEDSCLLLDIDGTESHGWGGANGKNVNIHLQGTGYKGSDSTPATPNGGAVANDAAFSFYTHDWYNGDGSTAQTVKTPWGFTLDDNAKMRIGRDDGPAHVLQLGGGFNGNGHTLRKIGGGVLEFGFGCTVEEGSTGGIVVEDGTLKLGYVEFGQSSKDEAVGLKNYAVFVSDGTTLDMDNRDHSLGSLHVSSNSELLNIQGTTITINGYGDGNLAPDGFEENEREKLSEADNAGLAGTSWVMNGGEQTVKNAGSLNEVEVNDGKLVLEGVSTVRAAAVNGGTLELNGDVTISTTLKADGGELMAHGSLTVKDGMKGTLDKLTINGGSDDKIVLGGSGEQVLRAREVDAKNGEAAIQIDISRSAEPHVRLDFGAISGTLHLKLTGYDDLKVSEYQLFVNNKQHRDLWASEVLKSDESWWKDVLSIEVSGRAWSDGMEFRLTDDGVLHFVPFDGLTWNGGSGNNVWKDEYEEGDQYPWEISGGNGKPAGQHVQFTDADSGSHEGMVLLDGMVTPKKVTVRKGTYVFEQKEGTTGGLNIVQVEVKKEDGSTGIEEGSGALIVGGESGSKEAHLTLALENTSIPEIQLREHGTLVLADDGALTNEDKVRGYKKTRLRFMGGTLDYSAYEGETLKDLDVSVYVDKDDSRDAAKVHVSGTDYANGVVWGGREKAMTSGVELALNGTGLELTGDGSLTLAWNETAGKRYGSGVGVKVVDEDATLVLDVGGKARADLADTFSGAGTLAITGGGMLKLSGDSTGMKDIELQDGFDVEIAGENALGGENTRLTLGNGGKLSSAADAKAQAGTVTVEGAITVGGNITFTGKVGEPKDKEKSTSFTVAEGKTAGFSGDISEYHGTLVAPDASSTWRMTDKAATGEVSVGLEGNGTFDFEVQNSLTLSVPDKPDEDGETVKGMIGSEGGSLTLKNSGAGNLIVASGTEQSGVKLDAGEKTGRITLGKDGDGAAITWAGTDLVQGDIVLANVTLAEGGFKDTGSAKIGVDTSVSPDKESGGTVDVSGMDAGKLSGITINEHGQLKGVTGRYDIGRHEDRMHYGLTLHFANTNERAGGDVALIQGGESEGGKFTLNLMGNAEDDLQFVFNAGVIAQLRSADAKDETLDLHLLSGGKITENGKELGVEGKDIKLGEMKDQIAQMLYGISATIVKDPKGEDEWYLQLSGSTSNLYVVMGREHSDLDYVEDMMIFTGTDATAVLDRKTLTLHHDGTSKGAGEVTLKNLVGTEGTVLELENTSPDDRFTVTLDNTHYSGEMNVGTDRDITGAEQTAMRGQDTVFEGRIHGTEGVDITKDGMGTLTVGGDYRLEDGTTRIEGGKLVLEGGENKMDKLEFAYDDEPGAGAQGNPPGAENPEERGLVLDGGRTTIDSIEEGGNNSNGNHVELSNAELVLKDKSELRSTTITGNEEKGGGAVTLDGSNAKLTFTGGKDRMKGVDVNLKNGGSLTLTGGAGMDVGDVNLSGKEGSRLDVGTGETKVDSLNGDRYSTLASDERWGCLRVREGGVFSGTLDSSSAAGTLIVENGANFTFDNVTTKTDDPTKGWDVQVGSDPAKAGGAVFTVDARAKEKSVTLGNVDLGTGNTTTFIVDPAKGGTGLLSGESIKWGKDSTLVLQGDGVYEGDSLTLGSFNTMGENGDDLQIELRGSAFFLKDEKKAKVVESSDGKLTVNFDGEAKDNKFERILPDMSKNAGAGASMVWDSLKEKDGMGALEDVFKNPDSDYAKMANGLIGMYDSGDKENLEKALASVAGASISTLGPALVQDLHRQLGAIRNRTTTMGGEVSYDSYDKLPMWHAWLNAEGSYHKMDADGFAPGYTLNNWGGTVGADVDVSTSTTLGFALTAMYGDLKPDAADAATGDLDTMYLSAFARTTKGAWIHTFVVSGGMADVNLDRTVNVGGASYRTQGSTDGYAVGALYEVGYTKLMNRRGTIALQPVFNVEIRHAAIKGYTETGSDAGLKVDDIEQDVVTFGVGARMQSIVGENFYNRTSILEARLLLKADVGDASGVSRNGIIGSTAMGEVESAEVGALGIEAGVGLTIPLGSTRGSVFIDASAEVRSGWTSFDATLGYRINF